MNNAWSNEGIVFVDADLFGTNLSSLHAKEVDFSNAEMTGSILKLFRIDSFASFKAANLDNADLSQSSFEEVDFSNASLKNANLSDITFSNANFYHTELVQAVLINFPFLFAVGLEKDQINSTFIFLPLKDSLLTESARSWTSEWDKENGTALVYIGKSAAYAYDEPWPQEWNIPANWLSMVNDARKIEILVFEETNQHSETCYYSGPGCNKYCPNCWLDYCHRIRFEQIITVIEAQSGNQLGRHVFQGSEPANCPVVDCGPQTRHADLNPPLLGEVFSDYSSVVVWLMDILDY